MVTALKIECLSRKREGGRGTVMAVVYTVYIFLLYITMRTTANIVP